MASSNEGRKTSMEVYPCSYSAHGPLIEWLMRETSTLFIDTRYKAYSVLPQWQEKTLRERYGKRYRTAGACLGNLNYKGGPIQIADVEKGIRGLLMYLREGYKLLLVCGCRQYETCHVKVIVELLRQVAPEVAVLSPDTIVRPDSIKCLSIRQSWAWIITHPEILLKCGIEPKLHENREWTTKYRGPLLLHAGIKIEKETQDPAYWIWKFGESSGAALAHEIMKAEMATKAIVGIADLVDMVTASESVWYTGSYGLVLHNARPLTSITYPGQQMLFDVPLSLIENRETLVSTK